MDWATVTLILGILTIVGILIIGGNATISKGSITIDTSGFLEWLRKAKDEKGISTPAPVKQVDPLPTQKIGKLPRATIAWVDDKPLNNVFERRAFASAGIFCDTYTTNIDALNALGLMKYDLIISDIGRKGVAETGWDLLSLVRKKYATIPFIFYTMGLTDQVKSDATKKGASGIAENPNELAQTVLDLITNRPQ